MARESGGTAAWEYPFIEAAIFRRASQLSAWSLTAPNKLHRTNAIEIAGTGYCMYCGTSLVLPPLTRSERQETYSKMNKICTRLQMTARYCKHVSVCPSTPSSRPKHSPDGLDPWISLDDQADYLQLCTWEFIAWRKLQKICHLEMFLDTVKLKPAVWQTRTAGSVTAKKSAPKRAKMHREKNRMSIYWRKKIQLNLLLKEWSS